MPPGGNFLHQTKVYFLLPKAMPKIGCGLDKLDWNVVITIIKNVFLETTIKIDVYCLETDIKPKK